MTVSVFDTAQKRKRNGLVGGGLLIFRYTIWAFESY